MIPYAAVWGGRDAVARPWVGRWRSAAACVKKVYYSRHSREEPFGHHHHHYRTVLINEDTSDVLVKAPNTY